MGVAVLVVSTALSALWEHNDRLALLWVLRIPPKYNKHLTLAHLLRLQPLYAVAEGLNRLELFMAMERKRSEEHKACMMGSRGDPVFCTGLLSFLSLCCC